MRTVLALALLAACTAEVPPTANQPPEPAQTPTKTTIPAIATAAPEPDGTLPMESDLVCLARTIYFEVRGRSRRELDAVAHVVLNRVRHPQFPDTVCGVVREGGQTPPCQFSWWCDGRSDEARNRREYARAVKVAREALAGETEDPTRGANMFHNRSVRPRWARSAAPRGRIGPHVFYYLENR